VKALVAVLAAGLLLAGAVRPPAARAAAGPLPLRVQTVPAVAGLRFTFAGGTHVTDSSGATSFFAPVADRAIFTNPFGLSRIVRLIPATRPDGSLYRVGRWYSKSIHRERTLVAALDEFVPTTIGFVNPKAGAVAPQLVEQVVVKRSDGAVFRFAGRRLRRPVLLQATRVVPLTGGLVSKPLLYRVQSVTMQGNSLVNRAQQAFEPASSPHVTLRLLFYSAKFLIRDRLFGFAVGSGIELRFPNGREHFYRYNGGPGEVDLAALPRGNYRVKVHAAGIGLTSPVAMTRDQVATIKVFSYIDLGVTLGFLLAVALGVLLWGRPELRRRLARSLRLTRRKGSENAEVVEA
jgi:hypothetical protein